MSGALSLFGFQQAGKAVRGAIGSMVPEPPQLMIETPPSATGTGGAGGGNRDDEARAAAEKRRKQAASGGRSDTLKTGAGGLGEVPSENLAPKTLLGY